MVQVIYAIALRSIDGVGDILFSRLIERFGSAAAVLKADSKQLEEVEGLGKDVVRSITRLNDFGPALTVLGKAEEEGVMLISLESLSYPPLLRMIPDPPSLLYVCGDLPTPETHYVAMVGSRNASPYGKAMTEQLASGLVAKGFTIVSGGARGIDAFAHRAALSAGGRTVVVLGSGIDIVYPPENERLFEEIGESGSIITDLPPGTPAEPYRFPKRNRIISGLSLGTVVVEATGDSGSLITARLAADQGREVFAVPGNVGNRNSAGVHRLICQGAKLTERVEDILEELFPQLEKREDPSPPSLEGEEEKIYLLFGAGPKHVDQLIEESRLLPQRVMGLMLNLELKGVVRQMPGQLYVKI